MWWDYHTDKNTHSVLLALNVMEIEVGTQQTHTIVWAKYKKKGKLKPKCEQRHLHLYYLYVL